MAYKIVDSADNQDMLFMIVDKVNGQVLVFDTDGDLKVSAPSVWPVQHSRNSISFGCINLQVNFYEKLVSPAFTGTNGIVYILPETPTAQEVFGSYDVKNL